MDHGEQCPRENGICRIQKKFVAFENLKESSWVKVAYSEQGSEMEHLTVNSPCPALF